jgi:hypothetical protein
MGTENIITAYRFDETIPRIGSVVHCFKTFEALEDFAKLQGSTFKGVRFWKIKGVVTSDEGGPDGWIVLVKEYKELYLELY